MAQRDVSKFSDISKSISEPDGSFNRRPSSFRNFIEKGGQYAPEKGAFPRFVYAWTSLRTDPLCSRTIPPLCLLRVPYVPFLRSVHDASNLCFIQLGRPGRLLSAG